MAFQVRSAPKPNQAQKVQLLCAPEGEAYRIYAMPHWMPDYLARCFDVHGEAYPIYLDLEELERQMKASGVDYSLRKSIDGSFEIDAEGPAAMVLTLWLTRMFASGTQLLSG